MSSSRWGGTKHQNCVVATVVRKENHSSNGPSEVIHTRYYCDWAHLAATKRSNECADGIGPLLLSHLCENYYDTSPFHFPSQKEIVNIIFSTGSSFCPQPRVSGNTCTHMFQQTCVASERRTEWSSKMLDIFNQVILMWVYIVVDMKYSRRGGTKVLSAVEVTLSSNGHVDCIGPLLLWPSSTDRKTYDINNKVSKILHRTKMYTN
jgi:hypothetical protein